MLRYLSMTVVVALALDPSASADNRWSGQGRLLQGQDATGRNGEVTRFPIWGWRTASNQTIKSVTVVHGRLVAAGSTDPAALKGATVDVVTSSGKSLRFMIKRIDRPPAGLKVDASASTRYYTLWNVTEDKPYCSRAPLVSTGPSGPRQPADADDGFQAVPVAQVWNAGGTEGTCPESFTMACGSGAIGKCYRWGYQGWRTPQMLDTVQACTRMARADYCGDGTPHTREGTPIEFFDASVVTSTPKLPNDDPVNGMIFETAWRGGNNHMLCVDASAPDIDGGGAQCLSKKRWDAIAVTASVGKCPKLLDPRRSGGNGWHTQKPAVASHGRPSEDPPTDFKENQFCDYFADGNVDFPLLKNAGALLFNRSMYLDGLLTIFVSLSGEHWTTTGLIDEGPDFPEKQPFALPPIKPEEAKGESRQAVLGSIFTVVPPVPVLERLPSQTLVPLTTYYDSATKDHFTTTGPAPAGYSPSGRLEGQIYPCDGKPPPAGSTPLYRVPSPPDGEMVTTTAPPAGSATCVSAGGSLEGYLPPLGD